MPKVAKPRAKPKQYERQGQALFFKRVWTDPKTKHLPIFAIPNGGRRNLIEAVNLKRSGVVKGVPDVFVGVPRRMWHGLFIEVKVTGNTVSPEQQTMIVRLSTQGYLVNVVDGKNPQAIADGLWLVLERYLTGKAP